MIAVPSVGEGGGVSAGAGLAKLASDWKRRAEEGPGLAAKTAAADQRIGRGFRTRCRRRHDREVGQADVAPGRHRDVIGPLEVVAAQADRGRMQTQRAADVE